jgi:hypothetical protein
MTDNLTNQNPYDGSQYWLKIYTELSIPPPYSNQDFAMIDHKSEICRSLCKKQQNILDGGSFDAKFFYRTFPLFDAGDGAAEDQLEDELLRVDADGEMTEMEFMSISRMSNAIKPTMVLVPANEPSMRNGGIFNISPRNASPGGDLTKDASSFAPTKVTVLAVSQLLNGQEPTQPASIFWSDSSRRKIKKSKTSNIRLA